MKINLVWFKRDLRVTDHSPLVNACQGCLPVLGIYIIEPSALNHYDSSPRHQDFINQSLRDLKSQLQEINIPLKIFRGEVIDVFRELCRKLKIEKIFSHQEVGNFRSFQRDLEMKRFFKAQGIPWPESNADGVIRGHKDRKNWDYEWQRFMREKISSPRAISKQPDLFSLRDDEIQIHRHQAIGSFQLGGESLAKNHLSNFFENGLSKYAENFQSTNKSLLYSSRLSAYLAYGNLSLRSVYQKCEEYKKNRIPTRDLRQFQVRLKWRSHFMQKFESDCSMEFKNQNKAFNHVRQKVNRDYLKAWKKGETGIPLIDASMRCLIETGFINFRMRSMLVSFLTHHLWQPWEAGAGHLARLFLDYEPGIHYPQFQMQAGTTGIHTLRIYNPIKQAKEKDTDSSFIQKWVPELANLPSNLAQTPWETSPMEEQFYGFRLGKNYPKPIVDLSEASKKAREILWETKNSSNSKKFSSRILKKHGRFKKRSGQRKSN